MSEWDMFFRFTITFFSIFGIFFIAWVITKLFLFDYIEHEELEAAEYLIEDYCNQQMSCEDCHKYMKDKKMCRYNYYMPFKWHRKE